MSKTSKALYLPLSTATSVTGGLLAGVVFGQIWKRFSDEEPAPPDPKDLSNSSRAALLGARNPSDPPRNRTIERPRRLENFDARRNGCGGFSQHPRVGQHVEIDADLKRAA
jgi:Protein of unknown function (DUF4235)